MSIGGMPEVFYVELWILRIDTARLFGYTIDDERQKTNNLEVVREERGLIPMAFREEPPVSQRKIDAEGNESEDLVS